MSKPASESPEGADAGPTEFRGSRRVDEPHRDGDDVLESKLLDLTTIPLAKLRGSGDSALIRALRRLDEDMRSSDDVVAGFQSAI